MLSRCVVIPLAALLVACPPATPVEPTNASATADESTSTTSDPGPTTSTMNTDTETTAEPSPTDATTTGIDTSDDTSTTTDVAEPTCGDGDVDPGEACDEGPENHNTEGPCTELCTLPTCGDGFLQRGEACDLGDDNNNAGACTNFCTLPSCGDGFVQPGESCDEGALNHDGAGGCHPETCQVVASTCGDGVLQADEECDASAQPDVAMACINCYLASRVVFATSALYLANFGGLAQADLLCQDHAWMAKLAHPERFIAWLSVPGTPMASRLEPLPFKYVRTDDVLVANGWDQLIGGVLEAPIQRDEFGDDASKLSVRTWTGTVSNGGEAGLTCLGWTSKEALKKGLTGSILATDAKWTEALEFQCSQWAHLYCVET